MVGRLPEEGYVACFTPDVRLRASNSKVRLGAGHTYCVRNLLWLLTTAGVRVPFPSSRYAFFRGLLSIVLNPLPATQPGPTGHRIASPSRNAAFTRS